MAFGETLPPVEPPAASLPALDSNRPSRYCWMSFVSLLLGCASVLLGPFVSIPAVVFGHFSRYRISEARGALLGNGLAFTGLVTGYLGFLGLFTVCVHPPREGVRRAMAKGDVQGIVTAVKSYDQEYGKLPIPMENEGANAPAAFECGGPSRHNYALFDIFRALPKRSNSKDRLNPRKIVFFDGRNVSDPLHPRMGFADQAQVPPELNGCYFDPWGHEYMIRINYNEGSTWTAPDGTPVKQNVVVWSLGPDGKSGTEDDIVSWK